MLSTELKQRCGAEAGFGLIEVLIAVIILVIGVVALAGITASVADQIASAEWQSEQILAGQQALDEVRKAGYAAAVSQVDTIDVDGHDFVVKIAVSQASARVKQVLAVVAPAGSVPADTISTSLYETVQLPDPPASP